MRIAVASGKGGTGKTTVAVALAGVAKNCVLVDCDVEAPNAAIFMGTEFHGKQDIHVMVPAVDESKCNGCAECSRVCQFNALAVLGTNVILFPELCHGCGGCMLVCDPKAITEGSRLVGEIAWGKSKNVSFFHGKLRIGEPMSPPLIKALKEKAFKEKEELMIIDCPPGTTCPMIEAINHCDYCLLVTEPTPFGLHDLEMAAEAAAYKGIPSGVIINRSDMGDGFVREYCEKKGLPILLEIPHTREIAEGYAAGKDILQTMPELKVTLKKVLDNLVKGALS